LLKSAIKEDNELDKKNKKSKESKTLIKKYKSFKNNFNEDQLESKSGVKYASIAFLLILPYLLWNLIFWVYPNIMSIPITFFNWSIVGSEKQFIGLTNFIDFLLSEEFKAIITNMFKFSIIYIPAALILSMLISLMLASVENKKLRGIFTAAIILPQLSSAVAYTVIFSQIFHPNSLLSRFVSFIFNQRISWFSNPNLVLIPIATMILWKSIGYYSLLLTANITSIPKEYHEAALLEGATAWTRFWKITFPLINPTFVIIVIFSVTTFFAIFAEPYMLTAGGPMLASHAFKLEIYHQIYERLAAGKGAAVAVIQGLISFSLVMMIRKILERKEVN